METHLASGSTVRSYDTLDSTSLEAKRQVSAGETGPTWIVAGRQTSGYGRRGAAWRQSEGDLAASFVFTEPGRGRAAAQLSYAAGLAVADVVAEIAPGARPELKWPNDVLVGGAKISGLLLELAVAEPATLVLGVGVNVVSKPEGLDYPTARLMDLANGPAPRTSLLLARLDAAFDRWRTVWRAEGFAPLRRAWTARAARLGEEIAVKLPRARLTGVLKGVDEDGALVLSTAEGDKRVTAGSVFFGGENAPSD